MRTLDDAVTDGALSANDVRVLLFCYKFLTTTHPRLVMRTYIAKHVHIQRETVATSLDRLVLHGYLVHEPRSDQQSRYRLPGRRLARV